MADLTMNLKLSGAWTNVTKLLSLEEDASYLFDIAVKSRGAIVRHAYTDTDDPPTAVGHPWEDIGDSQVFEQTADSILWMRVEGGLVQIDSALLAVSQIF